MNPKLRTNLDGDLYYTPEAITDTLIDYLNNQDYCAIRHTPGTMGGFESYSTINVNQSGFYVIYKNTVAVYSGYSDSSIANRIRRFIKEINGKSGHDEQHCGAKKYKQMFGDDLSGLSIKYIPMTMIHQVLPEYMSYQEIENSIICKLKPLFTTVGNDDKIIDEETSNRLKTDAFYYKGATLDKFFR